MNLKTTMLRKEIKVYSETYDVQGTIRDYGMVTKLFFCYEGREIVISIKTNTLDDDNYEEIGKKTIESYICNLAIREEELLLKLHYWYIDEREIDGKIYRFGHGIVTGHKKVPDATKICTSPVEDINIEKKKKNLMLSTANNVYQCPLEYCRFRKQDKYPDIIPDYLRLKERYKGKIEYPSIEPGKVLLVFANFCEYYFHSLYYLPKYSEDGKPLEYVGCSHIGTFQDSYLIYTDNYEIDIRYFPHFQNIEFYSEDTNDCPLFVENIGDTVIYVRAHIGTIKLSPGERKEVAKGNVEKEKPILPDGDLYPAGTF